MEEVKVRELPEKENIQPTDYLPIEDDDGTKKVLVKHFRALVLASIYFDNIDELKNNSAGRGLKDGDICQTLGYYTPGDGGGALYTIKYDPAAVEDNMYIHNLSYSDTLRAELIVDDKINVHQFGARGDGKTDDSLAIQTALDNAYEKTVEFVHGKKYLTKKSLDISNNNVILNGHGATLYPQYVTGLNISTVVEEDDNVNDVFINNLNIDGSRATNSIYINKSSYVHVYKSVISGSAGRGGIVVNNSDFITIENCEFNSDGGSAIVLEGDNNNCVRSMIVEDSKFVNFAKGVHLLSSGVTDTSEGISIIIENCTFKSDISNSVSVYVACPVDYMNLNSNIVTKAHKFLYFGGASSGDIYCNGVLCDQISTLFDFDAANGILHLDGSIRILSSETVIFENLQGKLHSNVLWDAIPTTKQLSDKTHFGELYDIINPAQYSTGGYGIDGSSLTLRSCHNVNVDWDSSTNNLEEIKGGFKGQLIHVKSSTGKSVINKTKKIVLSASDIQLGAYGVQLQFDGLQWVQVTKAPTGARGVQGVQGVQGIQGPKGDKGDKGDQGDKGDKGDQGIQGPKGDKGDGAMSVLEMVNVLYPVGTIYMSASNANPNNLFSGTTWVAWGSGRVPVGINTNDSDFNTVEKTGGEKSHTLSVNEIPSHNHNVAGQTVTSESAGAHTHSVGAHSHGLNNHTHSVSITIDENGYHTHKTPEMPISIGLSGNHVHKGYSVKDAKSGSDITRLCSTGATGHSESGDPITTTGAKPKNGTYFNGEHTHTGNVPAGQLVLESGNHDHNATGTIGAASGSTANSTAFNTGSNGAHTHSITIADKNSDTTGGGAAHNNLQPYIVCYMWKRTA